jgi:hypothetical protein
MTDPLLGSPSLESAGMESPHIVRQAVSKIIPPAAYFVLSYSCRRAGNPLVMSYSGCELERFRSCNLFDFADEDSRYSKSVPSEELVMSMDINSVRW